MARYAHVNPHFIRASREAVSFWSAPKVAAPTTLLCNCNLRKKDPALANYVLDRPTQIKRWKCRKSELLISV